MSGKRKGSRVQGDKALRIKLKRLPPEIIAGIATAQLRSIEDIQRDTVAGVPVGKTGDGRKALASKGAIGVKDKGLRVEFGMRTK